MTNLQALTYAVRLTGISYSSYSNNIFDMSRNRTRYIILLTKTIFIESKDTSNAQSPITREDFYDLLNKVLILCNHYGVYSDKIKPRNWY